MPIVARNNCLEADRMPIVVVTNCSSRKVGGTTPIRLDVSVRGTPNLGAVAASWASLIAQAPGELPAEDLYCGRSISDAKWASSTLGAQFHIVSAGLGLVPASDIVPNYDATVSEGNNWLAQMLSHLGATPAQWWDLLCVNRGTSAPLRRLISSNRGYPTLLAMPASYLRMIEHELADLTDNDLQDLRIFTSPVGQRNLPERLQLTALPYDERLEELSGFAGTQTDFPQRAMRHFVATVMDGEPTLERDKELVKEALRPLGKRLRPARQRLADAEIKTVLRGAWSAHRGESAELLSFLRKTAGIACEQGRFRRLWMEVRTELNAGTDGR